MKIPMWLDHLRKDRRGLPIPYVNRWGTEEKDELISIRFDPNIRMKAVFYDDSQETEPDFTKQNMHRQREVMAKGMCQVCAELVPYSRRVVVLSGVTIEEITLEGRKTAAIFEPWLCVRCALFATDKCPALIRRRKDEDLRIFPIQSRSEFTMTVSHGFVDGHPETMTDPVAMWAKIIIHPDVLHLSQR